MKKSPSVEASFSLSFSERLRAGWALIGVASILWLSFFPLSGIALLILMAFPGSRFSVWGIFVAVLCFGFVPFMFLFNNYKAHRADLKTGPYLYRFGPSGLQVSTRTSELKQSWAAIPAVKERMGILLVYFNKRCAHCIPVRALGGPEGVETVRQLASSAGVPRAGI